jgi:hypothetical protein
MVNIWKASTLVLTGVLVLVIGHGAVRDTSACETGAPTEEELSQVRLTSAIRFLDKAEQSVRAAPAAPKRPRAVALQQIALAKGQLKKALMPEPELETLPPPRPNTKAVGPNKIAGLEL